MNTYPKKVDKCKFRDGNPLLYLREDQDCQKFEKGGINKGDGKYFGFSDTKSKNFACGVLLTEKF